MPCWRMHCERRSICALSCALGCAEPGPPPGSRCLQDVWADWNAGDRTLTPEFAPRIWILLPVTCGSGKSDTPCERMHLANATAPASLFCPVDLVLVLVLVGSEEPQAAIASAQPRAASAIKSLRRWSLAALVSLALRNVACFPQARSIGQSRGYTSRGITRLSRRYALVTPGGTSRGAGTAPALSPVRR
jgi:hypothetical protein